MHFAFPALHFLGPSPPSCFRVLCNPRRNFHEEAEFMLKLLSDAWKISNTEAAFRL